jgi:hypothetical protein
VRLSSRAELQLRQCRGFFERLLRASGWPLRRSRSPISARISTRSAGCIAKSRSARSRPCASSSAVSLASAPMRRAVEQAFEKRLERIRALCFAFGRGACARASWAAVTRKTRLVQTDRRRAGEDCRDYGTDRRQPGHAAFEREDAIRERPPGVQWPAVEVAFDVVAQRRNARIAAQRIGWRCLACTMAWRSTPSFRRNASSSNADVSHRRVFDRRDVAADRQAVRPAARRVRTRRSRSSRRRRRTVREPRTSESGAAPRCASARLRQ